MNNSERIAEFYDKWVPTQVGTGVNLRHRTILRLLKREGLRPDHRVLEIGCGVGSVTGLVAASLRRGSILAVDISPKSIEEARRRLRRYENAECRISDMRDFKELSLFDVVFLPDVLEHIPVEQHRALFQTIRRHLKDTGFVLIHIPDPHYLDWLRQTQPEKLQIVDQSLHTDKLMTDVYASDLYLYKLSSHCIFSESPDYQALVLHPNKPTEEVRPRNRWRLRVQSVIARLFY